MFHKKTYIFECIYSYLSPVIASAGLLARFRLNDTNNMQYISELDNPTKIAIDWITGNIYYVEAGSKIVICNFNTQKCSKIYAVGKGRTVSAMAVDPLAG